MPLQGLDKKIMRQYLTAFWKKELNTGQDPSNKGKWLEKGAQGGGGLYGALRDTFSKEVEFDESGKKLIPELVTLCTDTFVNLHLPYKLHATARLSHTFQNSVTSSHSTTDSVKTGLEYEFKTGFLVAESKMKVSFEFSHSWTSGVAKTESKSFTVDEAVDLDVPPGRVYKVVLEGKSLKLSIPYRAFIYVDGYTETWFEDRVKGHYNYRQTIGGVFQKIAEWGLAGKDSKYFSREGNRGVITQEGAVNAQHTSDLEVHVYDITASYKEGEELVSRELQTYPIDAKPTKGILIKKIPVVVKEVPSQPV
jgi:hypothetical protein